MTSEHYIAEIEKSIATVEKDCRDEWPSKSESYLKGETIHRGTFGIIRYAEAYDPVFGLEGLENRNCVIKTIYLRRRFSAILSPKPQDASTVSVMTECSDSEESRQKRLQRVFLRTIMELFVLNRCRHVNIMHSHAVFMTDGDLHIVLPRLYALDQLIHLYRGRKQAEPIPVTIIAKILRQLCLALDFLQKTGIIHRDVNPENIFLTRRGTVKLGHFSQSRPLFHHQIKEKPGYMTPVGREEFMCFEKLHNIYNAKSIDDCLDYSFSADIWSLGVLVLSMVSYFPNEPHHKLSREFALTMHYERIPFIWFTVDMLQLRSRLVKSGGEELKLFLSNQLLTVSPERRATASSLLKTSEMKRWCLKTVEDDSQYIRNYFINEVDFANHAKLENDLPNYNSLESKNIPAEFYWDDTWSELEKAEFTLRLMYNSNLHSSGISKTYQFRFSSCSPLFYALQTEIDEGRLTLTDLIPLDSVIKNAVFKLFDQRKKANGHGEVEINVPRKLGNLNFSVFFSLN